MLNIFGESLVQSASFFAQYAVGNLNLDACSPQLRESFFGDRWVRIRHRRYHACDTSLDERVCTRRSTSLMAAGLKVDVQRCATRLCASLFQSKDLGVLQSGIGMAAAANYLAIGRYQHRTHARIRRGES